MAWWQFAFDLGGNVKQTMSVTTVDLEIMYWNTNQEVRATAAAP